MDARGRADGRGAEEVVEADTARRKPVEVGRNHLIVAGAAHSPCALVVAQNEQNVGACGVSACHRVSPPWVMVDVFVRGVFNCGGCSCVWALLQAIISGYCMRWGRMLHPAV